jgi:protein subunit release factor A
MKDRITDHRVGFSVNGIDRFMNGESLDQIVDKLRDEDDKKRLEDFVESIVQSKNAITVTSGAKQRRSR